MPGPEDAALVEMIGWEVFGERLTVEVKGLARDPGPVDAEVAGQGRPALDLAEVEKRLVVAIQLGFWL